MFLVASDFTGYHKVSTNNFTQTELTAYITKYELRYLQDLLGYDLSVLFIADLTGGTTPPPLSAIYLNIYNSLTYDYESGGSNKIIRSEGIKEMLKGFIFWEYTRNQPIENTLVGNVENVNENSVLVNSWKAGINDKYNRAIDTYKAIQLYIEDNSTLYPDYNGVIKEPIYY